MAKRILILAAILSLTSAASLSARTWTETNGRTFEAELIRVSGDNIVLDRDGRTIIVALDKFSDEDQEFARKHSPSKKPASPKDESDDDSLGGPSASGTSRTGKLFTGGKGPASDPFGSSGSKPKAMAGLARSWTDVKGRTIIAKFVDAEDDKVVLNRDGKISKVPFEKLSADDQQFVHQFLKDRGLPDPLPGAASDDDNPFGGSTNEPVYGSVARSDTTDKKDLDAGKQKPAKIEPFVSRTWTNTKGEKLRARMIDVEGNIVVLRFRNERRNAPFNQLSAEDQDYVKARLRERGETALLAALEPPIAPAMPVAPPPMVAQVPVNPPPAAQASHQPFTPQFPTPHTPSTPPVDPWANRHASVPDISHQPSFTPPPMPSYTPPTPPQPADTSVASPSSTQPPVMVGYCSKCNKPVASDYKGDTCPHCHVHWDYEELADGTKRHFWNPYTIAKGCGGLVVAIVIAFLRMRKS